MNDGSTDKSGIICEKHAEKDRSIKYIYQKNEGLSCASAAGDEDVFVLPDEGKVGQTLHEVLVQSPLDGIVHILDRRRKPESGALDQVVHMPVVALVPLVADEHVHELVDGHVVSAVVLQARLEGVVHSIEFHLPEFFQGVLVHFDFHDVMMLIL